MKYLFTLLIIFGIVLLSVGLYLIWQQTDANRLASSNHKFTQAETQLIKKENLPTHLFIPDLNINLQVIPAKIERNSWQTTADGVSYLTSSPIPGSEGNSVLYAHNWASLFGKLPNIKAGNVIEIEYADKTKKKFGVAYTLEVSPGDQSILAKSNDRRITLYTCTGFLDSKRYVAVAMLEE